MGADRLYVARTESAFSYAANTTKTAVSVSAPADHEVVVTEIGVSADGTSGTALALHVELCRWDDTSAGTSTACTEVQTRGASKATQATAAHSFSAEPTTLTVIRSWFLTPNMGVLIVQFPLGREPMTGDGTGIVLRVNNPTSGTTVNVRAYIEYAEL